MRKLLRSVARYRMQQAGWTSLNKRPVVYKKGAPVRLQSRFAEHWREFI